MNRTRLLVVLLLVVATVPTLGAAQQGNTTAPNGTVTTGPAVAEQVRVSAVTYDEAHLSVETVERNTVFNTSGPHALFSVSEPVTAARIAQSQAQVTVLPGGRQVLVEYADDAAPPDSHSLYELELFFADGSRHVVDLYATETGVSVAATELEAYAEYIDESQDIAEEWGYGSSPEELVSFIRFLDERANLVEGFLIAHVTAFFAWLLSGILNPFTIIVFLLSVAAIGIYWRRKHGAVLDALQSLPGRWPMKIERLELDYERAKRTADDDDLSEIPAIGFWADYYEDAFGYKSPRQMAQAAAFGADQHTAEGLQEVHAGVSELEAETIRDSWIEPILRHIDDPHTVLTHYLRAVEWMETKYNQGAAFRPAADKLEDLLDELEEIESKPGLHSRRGASRGEPAAGGDD